MKRNSIDLVEFIMSTDWGKYQDSWFGVEISIIKDIRDDRLGQYRYVWVKIGLKYYDQSHSTRIVQ